jgi:hypothetical protein
MEKKYPIGIDPQEVWDEFSEYVDDDSDSFSRYAGRSVMLYGSFVKALGKMQAPPDPEALTIADYEEVLSDHRRLVREIDVILNGDNAAKQASLCDLVGQIKELAAKQAPTGARWVKASERLPEKQIYVIVRNIETGQVKLTQNYGHNTGWDIAMDHRFKWDNTEWLDEGGADVRPLPEAPKK